MVPPLTSRFVGLCERLRGRGAHATVRRPHDARAVRVTCARAVQACRGVTGPLASDDPGA
jgi:hypothetical protein